ncbi:MAG: hypothetical protein ACRDQ0_21525, partial [Pseudonocardia sp.]
MLNYGSSGGPVTSTATAGPTLVGIVEMRDTGIAQRLHPEAITAIGAVLVHAYLTSIGIAHHVERPAAHSGARDQAGSGRPAGVATPTVRELARHNARGLIGAVLLRYLIPRDPDASVRRHERLGSHLVRKAVMGTVGRLSRSGEGGNYRLDRYQAPLERVTDFALRGSVLNEFIHTAGALYVGGTAISAAAAGQFGGDFVANVAAAAVAMALVASQRYIRARALRTADRLFAGGAEFGPHYRNWAGLDQRALGRYYRSQAARAPAPDDADHDAPGSSADPHTADSRGGFVSAGARWAAVGTDDRSYRRLLAHAPEYDNEIPARLEIEKGMAARLGIVPARLGTAAADVLLATAPAINWVVRTDGSVWIAPKNGTSHAVVADGESVRGAGEATLVVSGQRVVGKTFNPGSGHYHHYNSFEQNRDVMALGRAAFARHGIRFPTPPASEIAAWLTRRGHRVRNTSGRPDDPLLVDGLPTAVLGTSAGVDPNTASATLADVIDQGRYIA